VDLLSSPLIHLISQVIHSTSSPPTIADVNPKLIIQIAHVSLNSLPIPQQCNSLILQLNPPSHTTFSQLDSSHPFHFSPIIFTPSPSTRYVIQHLLRSLPTPPIYEKLRLKALQTASGNLNLDDEISETPLSLEEKIAKKWYLFKPMEQFDYRDSLVELSVDFLRLQHRPSHRHRLQLRLLYFAFLGRSGLKPNHFTRYLLT
jgi:hypothetical protein